MKQKKTTQIQKINTLERSFVKLWIKCQMLEAEIGNLQKILKVGKFSDEAIAEQKKIEDAENLK